MLQGSFLKSYAYVLQLWQVCNNWDASRTVMKMDNAHRISMSDSLGCLSPTWWWWCSLFCASSCSVWNWNTCWYMAHKLKYKLHRVSQCEDNVWVILIFLWNTVHYQYINYKYFSWYVLSINLRVVRINYLKRYLLFLPTRQLSAWPLYQKL